MRDSIHRGFAKPPGVAGLNPDRARALCGRVPTPVLHFLSGLCLLLSTGCAGVVGLHEPMVASYEPVNVHRTEPHLPPLIRRVALLPLTTLLEGAAMEFGRDTLAPVLADELGRVRQFELVVVKPEELRLLTGRAAWTGEEKLPPDLLEKLRDRLGVDAVLFVRLTQYHAYEPLSIGWRMKLVETEEPRLLWAVDEVFDARVPGVVVGARRFARQHPNSSSSGSDTGDVLSSPRRFGQYTANAVVATLPARDPGTAAAHE